MPDLPIIFFIKIFINIVKNFLFNKYNDLAQNVNKFKFLMLVIGVYITQYYPRDKKNMVLIFFLSKKFFTIYGVLSNFLIQYIVLT